MNGAPNRRGAWSDTLPFGRDTGDFGEYNGGAFVQETQSIGGASDFEKGIGEIQRDPLGSVGKVLGNIFSDPLGSVAKGAGTVAGGATQAAVGPWLTKGAFILIGVIALGAGLWSMFRSVPVEAASA